MLTSKANRSARAKAAAAQSLRRRSLVLEKKSGVADHLVGAIRNKQVRDHISKNAAHGNNALEPGRLTASYRNLSKKLGENPERIMEPFTAATGGHFNLFTLLHRGNTLQTRVY